MKTLFQNNKFEGLMLFMSKNAWKNALHGIREIMGQDSFFFFFDSERGSHLKIFAENFQQYQIDAIESLLKTLSIDESPATEDILFSNAPQNSLHRLKVVPKAFDVVYENDDFTKFLCQQSNVIVDALQYNDFFVQEKNRFNFAIQLTFMALVRADKNAVLEQLQLILGENTIDEKSPLIDFYNNVQLMETNERLENWVLSWLNCTEKFLVKNTFSLLVESVCLMLEISSFSMQLLLIIKALLKKETLELNIKNAVENS